MTHTRRSIGLGLVASAVAAYAGRGAPALAQAAGQGAASDVARAIHDRVLILDSHVDVLLPETPRRYYAADGGSRTSLDKLLRGGVDAVVLSIAVGPGPETREGDAEARREADARLAAVRAFVAGSGGRAAFARSADDVEQLRRDNRIAVILGFLNARALEGDLDNFEAFYEAGVRVAGLTHAGHNAFADSSRPREASEVERHRGLSPLGRAAVRKFNELGVLIDVSQLSTAALFQTLEATRAPVVASHSAVRALVDNTRNLSDAELDAVKANGGVVQVTAFNSYLRRLEIDDRIRALRKEYGLPEQAATPSAGYDTLAPEPRDQFYTKVSELVPKATVSDYVDHIEYVIRRIGIAHVGIGTDFNHGAGIQGFNDATEAPNVTAELVRRGYGEEQVAAIWGGNFLRVLRAAQNAAS